MENLRVGDKVVYCDRFGEEICEVVRITPTGRIRVSGHENIQFDKYGLKMGSDRGYPASIKQANQQEIEKIQQYQVKIKAYKKMQITRFDDITYEQAVKILKILDKEK